VALDPASDYAQSLGRLVSDHFASTSSPGFEFAWLHSATSQVVAGTRFELMVAGTNGKLLSAHVMNFVGESGSTELQVTSARVVGDVSEVTRGKVGKSNANVGTSAGNGLSGGVIAGIVVGSIAASVLAVATIAGAAALLYKKLKHPQSVENNDSVTEVVKQPQQEDRTDQDRSSDPISLKDSDIECDRRKQFEERNPTAVNVFDFTADKRRTSITARSPPIDL